MNLHYHYRNLIQERLKKRPFKMLCWIFTFLFCQTFVIGQVKFTSSNLPIVLIETDGQEILDDPRIIADMKIIDYGKIGNHVSDTANGYNGKINIEIRGSTSQNFPKKQYGLETQNKNGKNKNVSLLGLPPENDWILSAPYSDKTLIRNILAYDISRGLGHYAPRTRLCELVINEEYVGVYVLTEKIKRDENRVNISKLKQKEINGDDVTGGYIIKIDKPTGDSGPFWESKIGGINFQFEYPKHDEIVSEQKKYIKNYIDSFEQALISDDFTDPEIGYRQYINEDSFIDFFIVNELSKNVDAFIFSTYFYKDKDSKGGKLTMGPVWDFNLSFGNADYKEGFSTKGFQVNVNESPWWWNKLLSDSTFVENLGNRWSYLRNSKLSDNSMISKIDSLSLVLNEAQERNFNRWNILGTDIWPNHFIGDSYLDEITFLKDWTLDRLHHLDNNFSYPILSIKTGTNPFNDVPETNLYPNPFVDNFTYVYKINKSTNVSLCIYDVTGNKIIDIIKNEFRSEGTYTYESDLSGLASSIYFLELQIDGQTTSSEKIVKL